MRSKSDSNSVAPTNAGTIELVEADLLVEGGFDAAFAGCRYVFHTASPFFIEASDPQAQLVDPAVKGTRNVMESAARNKADVRRVVLTSSCAGGQSDRTGGAASVLACALRQRQAPACRRAGAAIKGGSDPAPPKVGDVYSEADWNGSSALPGEAYWVSKTQAERTAWEVAEKHGLDLVTILPGAVQSAGGRAWVACSSAAIPAQLYPTHVCRRVHHGPRDFGARRRHKRRLHEGAQGMGHAGPCTVAAAPDAGPQSRRACWTPPPPLGWLQAWLEGTAQNFAPVFADVRDVARAHILAAENPAASGRFIVANTHTTSPSTISAWLQVWWIATCLGDPVVCAHDPQPPLHARRSAFRSTCLPTARCWSPRRLSATGACSRSLGWL